MKKEEINYKESTICIDNGTYEIKGGYVGNLTVTHKNVIYKFKNKYSFEVFPGSQKVSAFDQDIVSNFDVLGYTLDCILTLLAPKHIDTLILTITPHSPTANMIIDYIFTNYKFKKIILTYDFISVGRKYFNDKEDHMVISLSNSGTFISYIKDNKVDHLQKLEFGGVDLKSYINHNMFIKYTSTVKRNYDFLLKYCRVANNYEEESLSILKQLKNDNYSSNLFLDQENSVSDLGSINGEEKRGKKVKEPNTLKFLHVPVIDYSLIQTKDSDLDLSQLKEKRKQRLIFYSTLSRYKTQMKVLSQNFIDFIDDCKNEVDKKTDFGKYLNRRKEQFERLKQKIKDRELLIEASNKVGTFENSIRYTEQNLSKPEEDVLHSILEAEDSELGDKLQAKLLEEAELIKELDPSFIAFYATPCEILRGDNIKRECVNVELIKWPEIFFNPSIVRMSQMGISEALEKLSLKYKIENVIITGGLSKIPNMANRIYEEVSRLTSGVKVKVKKVENTQSEPFYSLSKPILSYSVTRKEWEESEGVIDCTI